MCAEVTYNDRVEESCLDCIGCGYAVRSNNGLVQNRSDCVHSNGLDEVTLRIDFITAFVSKLHAPRCWYLQRSHKNSQIYTDAKHEYERETLTHVRCEVLIAVTVVWLVTRLWYLDRFIHSVATCWLYHTT